MVANGPAGRATSVLISGAGIAGPALAFWLVRCGFKTTLIEQAPSLREGGQAVDFRGPAHLAVLERMGLLEAIRAHQSPMGDQHFVDETGRKVATMPAAFMSGDVEILRGDLSRLLYEATRDHTEYLFGDSIASMAELSDGIEVSFERAAPRRFDLVVGADGLRSQVRTLHFGPEQRFVHHLGYYVAGFHLPNQLGLDRVGMTFSVPGRGLHLQGISQTEARATFVFASPERAYDRRDQSVQKRMVDLAFAGLGWKVPSTLDALRSAPELYFDSISRVDVPSYARGQVVLLGDAAHGGTIGGGGSGCAIVGAYVLAGELAHGGEPRTALARYESLIRPYATRCQSGAEDAGPMFAPRTRAQLWARNTMLRLMASPRLSDWLNRLTSRDASRIVLPDYQ